MKANPFFILVVDPDPTSVEAWRQAVLRARTERQVYTVETPSEAIEYMLKVRGSPSLAVPGIVLIQCGRDRAPLASIARWLRLQRSLSWVMPVALVDARNHEDLAGFYEAGARSCLQSPDTVEDRACVLTEIRDYWGLLNVWPSPRS